MSYILDALNKAEKERHLGDVPTIETNHDSVRLEKKSRLVPLLVITALLLNFGLIAYLFLGKPDSAVAVATQAANEKSQAANISMDESQVTSPVRVKLIPPAEEHSPVDEINRKVSRLAAMEEKPQKIERAPEAIKIAEAGPSIEASAVQFNASDANVQLQAAASDEVPYLTEKPAAFQQAIPDINIDVHVYSDTPSKRFILINLKKYQEEERIAKGLMLEEITKEGLILSYEQEKFRWPMLTK